MRTGKAGYLLIISRLPEDLRPDPDVPLTRKEVQRIFAELARRYPDRYREISAELQRLAAHMAYWSGGSSFSARHLVRPAQVEAIVRDLRKQVEEIAADDRLTTAEKRQRILEIATKRQAELVDLVQRRIAEEDHPLYHQLLGAGRGNVFSINSLLGSDVIYGDHSGSPIPVVSERSFGQGLSLMEFLASSYGARQGVLSSKFAIRKAGFLAKSLQQAVHREVVSSFDRPPDDKRREVLMLPVEADDPDNEGAVLAKPVADIPAGTVLTPKHLMQIKRRGIKKIYVRSPLLPGDEHGGLYAVDVGVRENGTFPPKYSVVGLTAAQALMEPVAQGQLNVRHAGGLAGVGTARVVTGFGAISALSFVPEHIRYGATHAEVDGKVEAIKEAPAGGWNIFIDGVAHYVPPGRQMKVKVGDTVEAGDVLTSGIPSPKIVTEHKGIGEGRRYFVKAFREALSSAGHPGHRRNIELLARGLVNHVVLDSNWEDWYEGETVPYDTLVARYKPREGAKKVPVTRAAGKFLEDHYLHYTIGTKVRPSVLKELQEAGIKEVLVHDEPPFFRPTMVGANRNLQYDEDWMVRLLGSYQERSLLSAARRGAQSSLDSTSFVPARAHAKLFGRIGLVRSPQPWEDRSVRSEQGRRPSLWQTSLSRAGEGRVVPALIWEGTGVADHKHEDVSKWK